MQKIKSDHDSDQEFDDQHDLPQITEDSCSAGSWTAGIFGLLCFPITMFSCYSLEVNQEAVILRYGKFAEYQKQPGCHFSNCIGRNLRTITVARQTIDLPSTKIVDLHGNPLRISAIVTFNIQDSMKAVLNVMDSRTFVFDQAGIIMKQVVSRYPYESHDGSPSLKSETETVQEEMVHQLQKKVNVAGIKIISFNLNEIAYAAEIAAGMLKRQQAQALVAARRRIVEGAVEISYDAVTALSQKGIELNDDEKTQLVRNLLTVICSDKDLPSGTFTS